MSMTFTRNPNFLPAVTEEVKRRMAAAGTAVRDRARQRMQEPGTGEQRYGARRASAPGESPVTQTGELSDSLQTWGPFIDQGDVIVAVGSPLRQLFLLEVGTAKIEPRPLLYPSLMDSQRTVMQIMGGSNGS